MDTYNSNLKTMVVNGITLKYASFFGINADATATWEWTEFYEEDGVKEVEKTYRKYWFFGPLIPYKVIEGDSMFSINRDINDPKLSKEWWKEKIESALEKPIALKKRKEELLKGEVI